MTKNISALLGILLLVLGGSSLLLLQLDRASAEAVDESFQSGDAQPTGCSDLIRDVSLTKRVMTEKDSQTLRVVLANVGGREVCETVVQLAAIDFELSPAATSRLVALEPGGSPVTLLWILKPRETGSFEIALTAGNEIRILGIVVTNVLGFTAVQVEILSVLSTVLGPMLTAPWWYEQYQKRRKAKLEAAVEEPQTAEPKARPPASFRPE